MAKKRAGSPKATDLVSLSLGQPIFSGNNLVRGFVRVHADGSTLAEENAEPFGFIIPAGRKLVVTELGFFASFARFATVGELSRVYLGRATVTPELIQTTPTFMVAAPLSPSGTIGGNVSLHTGVAIDAGCYASVSFTHSELLEAEVYAHGYLV